LQLLHCWLSVGLILEYWHEVRDLIRERPIRWKSIQKLAGAILVTIGVAGELGVQFKASTVETDLRGVNHKVEALLSTEAGDARRAAGEAMERASNAELRIVELLAEIQPRDLTLAQQKAIRDSLSRFSGQHVLLGSYVGDAEGYRLSRQLIAALKPLDVVDDGGYKVGPTIEGILVCGENVNLVGALSKLLRAEIGKLAISSVKPPDPEYCVKDASIVVGMKPLAVLK
jgi:hypothetical protein